MHVKVRVVSGRSAGKELTIRGKKFLIGRSEECNLRPQSDTISRKHCQFSISDEGATIQDLGSRNGTVVNSERIDKPTLLNVGDQLRIGALHFLVLEVPTVKVSKASASASGSSSLCDGDSGIISDWLNEAHESDRTVGLDADVETRQYKFEDTERVVMSSQETIVQDTSVREDSPEEGSAAGKSKKKKKPGKLPPVPAGEAPKDTQEAAAQMLRKFFKRG